MTFVLYSGIAPFNYHCSLQSKQLRWLQVLTPTTASCISGMCHIRFPLWFIFNAGSFDPPLWTDIKPDPLACLHHCVCRETDRLPTLQLHNTLNLIPAVGLNHRTSWYRGIKVYDIAFQRFSRGWEFREGLVPLRRSPAPLRQQEPRAWRRLMLVTRGYRASQPS